MLQAGMTVENHDQIMAVRNRRKVVRDMVSQLSIEELLEELMRRGYQVSLSRSNE